jgi:fermentation-respiration switch protein FrsA (DUF1100 family)
MTASDKIPSRSRRWARRAALLSGAGAAGYAALGAWLAWGLLCPPRTSGSGTPADYGLEYEPVTITSVDGIKLDAWYVPSPGTRAGVVLCHGYRANRQCLAGLLPFLHRAGFAVVAFDFRAMGASEGRTCSFGYAEKGDVRAAARYLQSRERLGPGRVGALGLSMGAASAIMAAADEPAIGAVVADSPFARLDEIAVYRFGQMGSAGSTLGVCTQWWAERMAGFSARSVAPAAVVERLSPRPLLIIHGDADLATPLSQARELYAAAGEPKQLWIVPGAHHVACHDTARDEYERRVTAFFRAALLE